MVRVLVVEDETNIRDMIALNLRHAGMEVVEAESAEAALPLLAQKPGCPLPWCGSRGGTALPHAPAVR